MLSTMYFCTKNRKYEEATWIGFCVDRKDVVKEFEKYLNEESGEKNDSR